MITNGKFVSRVIGELNSLSKDDHISRRLVLSTGETKARFLLSQKLDEMTLFKEEGIISHIPCFEMESVLAIDCPEIKFDGCHSIMKSVLPIPETIFGKNGSGIVRVMIADGSKTIEPTTVKDYASKSKRKYIFDTSATYYLGSDMHVYLPESEIEIISLDIIALRKWEAKRATSCKKIEECVNIWEEDFVCPDRFLDLVVKDTLQELASIYKSLPQDENPNLDSHQKTKTIA